MRDVARWMLAGLAALVLTQATPGQSGTQQTARPAAEEKNKPAPKPKPKPEPKVEASRLVGTWAIRFKCGFYSYDGTLEIASAGSSAVRGIRINRYETAQIYGGSFRDRVVVLKTAFTTSLGKDIRDEYTGVMSEDGRSISGTYVGEFDRNDDCTWTAQRK